MKISELRKILNKHLLLTEIAILSIIIIVGAIVFHLIEGWNMLDSFYFIITATSTVGFGDITPQTNTGKVLFMFYTAIGIPFFISIGGLMLETRFKSNAERYIRKIHTEIHDTENEIEEIEKNIKRLKKPSLITEERIENIEREMQAIENHTQIELLNDIIPRRKKKVF